MRRAVVYYSMSGNVDYVAKTLAKELRADLIRLIPKKEYPNKGFQKFYWGGKSAIMGEMPELENGSILIDSYDMVIIGSPVWASRFAPPMKTFIMNYKDALKDKKIGAFLCYSGMGASKAMNQIKELLDVQAEALFIDPKEKNTKEKEDEIYSFCKELKKLK